MAALEAARARRRTTCAIRAAIEALDLATKPFAEARMNRAIDARRSRGSDVDEVDASWASTLMAERTFADAEGHVRPGRRSTIEVRAGHRRSSRRRRRRRAQVGSACGGVCACSTCHVYVKQGLDSLSEIDGQARRTSWTRRSTCAPTSRLGCQSKIAERGRRRRDHPREPPGVLDEHPAARPAS